MKALRIWGWALLIIIAGCNENKKKESFNQLDISITLSGIIENGENQLVSVDRMGANAFIPMDSVRCDEEGKFEITFQNTGIDFYSVKYSTHGYITLIAKPGDKIKITGSTESMHPYTVEGSNDSKLVQTLSLAHRNVLDQLQEISKQTNEILGGVNYSELKQELNLKYDSITNDFHDYSIDFIKNNSSSPAILFALYNQYGPRLSVFQLPKDMDIYKFADSSLFAIYPYNEAVLALHMQLITVEQQNKLQQKKIVIKEGMAAPDFVMLGSDGEMLSLTDLRGNYVLIQFWSSWSKLSMDENIYLTDCYNKFHNRSFTILQVSIDDDKKAWLSAIKKMESKWYHVSDLQRWESKVLDLYDVERIPANFLVNPEGIIVEKDLFGEKIEQTIGKYIK